MQARQVHIVYTCLTMKLPGETSQQEQLLHHVQEQTQISTLQSYHLPCAPCCSLLSKHTNVLTMQHSWGQAVGYNLLLPASMAASWSSP